MQPVAESREPITYESPFVDDAVSPKPRMRRVPDVIDCWYDSGAMPFAQWGYRGDQGPRAAREKFAEQFPADFISPVKTGPTLGGPGSSRNRTTAPSAPTTTGSRTAPALAC